MNKADLIVDLENLIGPGVEVDGNGLATWLNGAYMYMVDAISKANPDYFVDSATSNAEVGRQEYDLPTDNEKVLMVNIQYGGVWRRALPLPDINSIPVHENTSSGQGYSTASPVYYIVGDQIGFLPIPSLDTDLIKIWYVYTPDELVDDDDVPVIPKKYHSMIKYGAYADYLDQDDEHVAAENMRRRFDRRVEEMVENLFQNQVDEPRSVTITTNQDLYTDGNDYV